jgi:FkbH-like protein
LDRNNHHSKSGILAMNSPGIDKIPTVIGMANKSSHHLNVLLLSTYTVDFLMPHFAEATRKWGLEVNCSTGPFNQVSQELLDPDSKVHRQQQDVILILSRIEDIGPDILLVSDADESALETRAEQIISEFMSPVHEARQHLKSKFLVANFSNPLWSEAGIGDAGSENSSQRLVNICNELLSAACRSISDVYVLDFAKFVRRLGEENVFDLRMEFWSRSPFNPDCLPDIGNELARYVAAMTRAPCKCLVLDLDNTLWGGILGEDGPGGIEIGDEYPGNAYKEFQRYLKGLKARGLMLAVASKNNPADVEEAFRSNPNIILELDDFVSLQIHWNDKVGSIKAVADELNIGIDAIAFFDDNPAERELVRTLAPEVKVIDAPAKPYQYIDAVEESGLFDNLTPSSEDHTRTEMYKANRHRNQLKFSSVDLEGYLKGLGMMAEFSFIGADNIARCSQLLAKTNQFNLTMRRHSAADVERKIQGGSIGLCLRVVDKFGDNGLIGMAIAIDRGTHWEIDSFLVSCRVLGRRVEQLLLERLLLEIRNKKGAKVRGLYVEGPKNAQVADFYKRNGFVDEAGIEYEFDLDIENYRFGTLDNYFQIEWTGK